MPTHATDLGEDVHAQIDTSTHVLTLETTAGARIALLPATFLKLRRFLVNAMPPGPWVGAMNTRIEPDFVTVPRQLLLDVLDAAEANNSLAGQGLDTDEHMRHETQAEAVRIEQLRGIAQGVTPPPGGQLFVPDPDPLTRIADAIEKIAPNGMLDPYFFEQAAYQAGLAFERGRR